MTSLVFGSRLPVGSSARMSAGPVHERAGDRHALLLAARQLARAGVAAGRRGRPRPARRPRAPAPPGAAGARAGPAASRSRAPSSRPGGCRTGRRSRPPAAGSARAPPPAREEVLAAERARGPAVGRSSAPSRCSRVDLPTPEAPTSATISPAPTVTTRPRSTRTSSGPGPVLLLELVGPRASEARRAVARHSYAARRRVRARRRGGRG